MAEFSEFLHKLKPLSEMDVNMEQLKQLPQPNPSLSESFSASDFSVDSFLTYQLHHQQQQQQEPEISQSYYNDHDQLGTFSSGMFLSSSPGVHTMISSNQIGLPENKKRKAIEQSSTCCSSKDITPPASVANASEKNKVRICKKGKIKHVEIRAEEVIHVRAKRGQATDSHSIAERVRREKINNKLRCLQDLVPGCHKSMGMAVMLEEIINYVHSLQNQVEFLSMELAAASSSYGLNLERLKRPQGTNPGDEQEMQKWRRQQFGEINCFHSTWSI